MTKRDSLFFEMYWGLPLPWLLRSPWDGAMLQSALLVLPSHMAIRPVSIRPLFQLKESRTQGLFFKREMRQQIGGQVTHPSADPRADALPVIHHQGAVPGFDLIEDVGDPAMIGHQPV